MGPGFRRGALFLVAGPCVVEDDSLNLRVAEAVARLSDVLPGGVIFKASFDKANRSNAAGFRGPGINEGLERLERVSKETGLSVLTDVHLPGQCREVSEVAHYLQIPAFLSRQTDLLKAAGATGRAVNIKKGQWMSPEAIRGAVDKVYDAAGAHDSHAQPGTDRVAVTERGTFFGYGDLVVDMRSFARMRQAANVPVIFDGTHSVQQPGRGEGGSSGGAREHIPALVLAAAAAGVDGLFLETHPDPANAPSDGANMLPLEQLEPLIRRAVAVWEAARG